MLLKPIGNWLLAGHKPLNQFAMCLPMPSSSLYYPSLLPCFLSISAGCCQLPAHIPGRGCSSTVSDNMQGCASASVSCSVPVHTTTQRLSCLVHLFICHVESCQYVVLIRNAWFASQTAACMQAHIASDDRTEVTRQNNCPYSVPKRWLHAVCLSHTERNKHTKEAAGYFVRPKFTAHRNQLQASRQNSMQVPDQRGQCCVQPQSYS